GKAQELGLVERHCQIGGRQAGRNAEHETERQTKRARSTSSHTLGQQRHRTLPRLYASAATRMSGRMGRSTASFEWKMVNELQTDEPRSALAGRVNPLRETPRAAPNVASRCAQPALNLAYCLKG